MRKIPPYPFQLSSMLKHEFFYLHNTPEVIFDFGWFFQVWP